MVKRGYRSALNPMNYYRAYRFIKRARGRTYFRGRFNSRRPRSRRFNRRTTFNRRSFRRANCRRYFKPNQCGFWYTTDVGIQEMVIPASNVPGVNSTLRAVFYANNAAASALRPGQNENTIAIIVGDNVMDQSTRLTYASLYDAYRVRKIRMVYWLKDTDQFTEANYQTVRVIKAYDPDALGRTFATEGDYTKILKKRQFFMKPNQRYKTTLRPDYGIVTGRTGTTASVTNSIYGAPQKWQDIAVFGTRDTSGVCNNAWQMYIDGNPEQKIAVQIQYYIEFKGRRNNQTYGNAP